MTSDGRSGLLSDHPSCSYEPVVSEVSVSTMTDRALLAMQPVSARGHFIASVSRGLRASHNKSWQEAVDMAKACWQAMDPRDQAMLAAERGS